MRFKTLIALVSLTVIGCGGSTPPPEFMKSRIAIRTTSDRSDSFTVERFVQAVSEQKTSVRWAKLSNDAWMATLKNTDKMSGQRVEMKVKFVVFPEEKATVLCDRLIMNGVEGGDGDIAALIGSVSMKVLLMDSQGQR